METIDTSGGERSPEQGLIQHIAELEKQVAALQEKADMYDFLRTCSPDHLAVIKNPEQASVLGTHAMGRVLRGADLDKRVKRDMIEAAKIKRMRKMGITGPLSASDVRRFKL